MDEIELLKSTKSIAEKIAISKDNYFSFSIQIVNKHDACFMNLENNSLEVSVPSVIADKWMNSNQIGIKETIRLGDGGTTNLIVEEDLPPRKNRK